MKAAAVAIVCQGARANSAERSLQAVLDIPLLYEPIRAGIETPFFLRYEPQGLTLHQTAQTRAKGLWVDFSSSTLNRRSKESLRKQGLGKAIGLKGPGLPLVLDATAGLGTDAFLLACHGCTVVAYEKDPVVYALLQDGWRRGRESGQPLQQVLERITLYAENFCHSTLQANSYDVVYLDPMFPPGRQSARVKKPMLMLQELLGHDAPASGLLSRACTVARRRVVVKRAKLSPWLDDRQPDLEFTGSSNRYDVYFQFQGGEAP